MHHRKDIIIIRTTAQAKLCSQMEYNLNCKYQNQEKGKTYTGNLIAHLSSWLAFLGLSSATGFKNSFQVSTWSSWMEAKGQVTVANPLAVWNPGCLLFQIKKKWCIFSHKLWQCPRSLKKNSFWVFQVFQCFQNSYSV